MFMDRLLQHLPETLFRQVRHYGLFSNAKRTELLRTARRLLAQRKKRRPTPETWVKRRQAAGDRKPLSCPRCGHLMELWCLLFGKPQLIAQLLGIDTNQRIPPNTLLSRSEVSAVAA